MCIPIEWKKTPIELQTFSNEVPFSLKRSKLLFTQPGRKDVFLRNDCFQNCKYKVPVTRMLPSEKIGVLFSSPVNINSQRYLSAVSLGGKLLRCEAKLIPFWSN